jgi:hypothetical protein
MKIPATSDPWRPVEHEGIEYIVRFVANACWVVRVSDAAVWFFADAEAPAWARAKAQADLF